jgi:carboxyl-terminal processing protease
VVGEMLTILTEHYLDARSSPLLPRLRAQAGALADAPGAEAFYTSVDTLLAEAGNAHLRLLRPGRDLFGAEPGRLWWVGASAVSWENSIFVGDVLEGSPAERGGLLPGDELLPVDGVVPQLDPLTGPIASLRLLVRRRAGEEPFTVDLTPVQAETLEVLADATRASARVIMRQGCRIGVLHLRTLADENLIEELATGAHFAEVDALILDLRGNRGGSVRLAGEIFDLITRQPSVWLRTRDGLYGFPSTSWSHPLAVLVDSTTASAAEILAAAVQARLLGAVIGTPTAGVVSGSRPFPLPDGSQLIVPVSSVAAHDGTDLEGKGVSPDLTVWRPPAHTAGADPLFERAVLVLLLQTACSEPLPEETFPQEKVGVPEK